MSEIDNKKGKLQIHGIKKIPISIKEFVELLIILFFNDGEEIRLQTKIHDVNRLFIDILLKNNFLRQNGVNILVLLLINGLPVLQIQRYFIILKKSPRFINLLKTSRKRTVIKTIKTLIIIAGIK
jgi:hypothetical protein